MLKIAKWVCLICLGCAAQLFAAEATVDLNTTTPAITKVKARMAAREAKLEALKNSGAAGEALSGQVEALPVENMSLAEKKSLHDTLAAENEDRSALFRELALASQKHDASAAAAAYARFKRQNAAANQFVQQEKTMQWVLKKDLRD